MKQRVITNVRSKYGIKLKYKEIQKKLDQKDYEIYGKYPEGKPTGPEKWTIAMKFRKNRKEKWIFLVFFPSNNSVGTVYHTKEHDLFLEKLES